jgi:hypothetical protein
MWRVGGRRGCVEGRRGLLQSVCTCLLLQDLVQSCLRGEGKAVRVGGGQCVYCLQYLVPVCVFITAGPSTKLFTWGGGDMGGHVLRETTSRGLCGLGCPSRTGTHYKAVCVVFITVCVFYYCRTYYKAVRVGGGGEWRTGAMRDDEPRPVWMSLLITH